jgi:TPP-dependent pyruvate/acetoin dehydrogenase alpha subunit
LADADTLKSWRDEAVAKVDEAIATAQTDPQPEADREDWCAISQRELVDPINDK